MFVNSIDLLKSGLRFTIEIFILAQLDFWTSKLILEVDLKLNKDEGQ